MMTAGLRTFALTFHVTFSVGWMGSVASFLVLAVAGVASRDPQLVRGAYVSMDVVTWFLIVPLSFASLATGLVMSFGTSWGVFRHYWVVAKLFINILATALLLVHTRPISQLAAIASHTTISADNVSRLQVQLVGDAALALLALIAATVLSVYKPGGLTGYGRQRAEDADKTTVRTTSLPLKIAFAVLATIAAVIVVLHLSGGSGLHRH